MPKRPIPEIPKDLLEVSSAAFSWRLGALTALYLTGGYLVILGHLWSSVLGTLLIGIAMTHGVELQHQALHGHGFKNRHSNRLVGYLLGLPMLVMYSHYQARHLWHHRHVGTSRDSEFFDYQLEESQFTIGELVFNAFDLSLILRFVKYAARSALGLRIDRDISVKPAVESRIRWEYAISTALLLTVAVGCYHHLEILAKLWLLPLVLIAIPCHFLVELPEHILCNRNSVNVVENTRTIVSGPFGYWFTNGNNFHVEHHMYPSVPMNKLHRVHAFLAQDISQLDESYRSFLRKIIKI